VPSICTSEVSSGAPASFSDLFPQRDAGKDAALRYYYLTPLRRELLVAALACVGYGSVFLMSGIFFRNPMIPAAVVMIWENLNPFLPTVLKKISVIFYLKNLCTVEIPIPPPFNVMVIDADPTPFWIAVPGLLVPSLILLAYSGISARYTENSYGE
jgi:hypothetical protein